MVQHVKERIAELFHQVRFATPASQVLVGHSHWIRELLRANLHASVAAAEPAFAKQLRSRKLSNCGVARLDLDFGEGAAATPIVGVRLLAGTTLVK